MKYDIEQFEPCSEALEYYKNYNSFEDAWNKCPRGDWMLWIALKLGINKRLMVLTNGRCAATVKHLMKGQRSLDALKACEDYGNGLIDDDMLKAATDIADINDAVFYTDGATFYAAHYADGADFFADFFAFYDAAKLKYQQETADICRELLTDEVFKIIAE